MEQAQYWKWMMRRRQVLKSHFEVSMNSLSDSWEEKAFAEDAARCLGGCSWPPRSYCCSFCSREFRSAQALGGHMNVHRRDRARLKQSLNLSPDNNEVVVPSPHHRQNHNKNPDPKSAHDDKAGTLDQSIDDLDKNSSVSASRVSALSAQANFSTSSIAQEKHKRQSFGSDSTAKRPLNHVISGSKPEPEKGIKLQEGEDSLCLGADDDDNHVETNLSVGLNSVFIQNRRPTVTCGEEAINYKRPKVAVSTLQYSPLQWQQALGLKPATSMDGLDLELRLGVLL